MTIEQDQIVAIEYAASANGEVIDSNMGAQPLHFMFGRGQMMPGLESRIAGMNTGDSAELHIPAAEAYGEHNPEAFQNVPKEHLAHLEIEVGMVLQGQDNNGSPVMVTVKEIHDEHVIMDHNHPLAGQNVDFNVTIKDIRNPTEDELSSGVAAENQQHVHDHSPNEGGGCGGGSCGCHS